MSAAARLGDLVLGIDPHLVILPNGTPLMVPLPFVGLFMVSPASTVHIKGAPAAHVGSIAINLPPHLPAPGVAFVIPPTNDAHSFVGSLTVIVGAPRASAPGTRCSRVPTRLECRSRAS
jgi:hypothetical protein